MIFWISIVLAATIILPAVAGIFRFRHIPVNDRWLVVFVWCGAVNEVTSLLTAFVFNSNAGTSNVYIIIETGVLLLLFYNWCTINIKSAAMMFITLSLLWATDNFYFGSLQSFYGFYPLLYSLVMILLSMKLMLRTAAAEAGNVFTNGRYITGGVFMLYFAIKALTESFFVFDDGLSQELQTKLVFITLVTNALTNIIYVHAILCFRRRTGYLQGC
jgi:hypothetical protein